jgi:putative peptidoglycan lipid II flippase
MLYALVVAGSAGAALLGFGREAALGALFGASRSTDAFYAALTIPFIAAYFLVGGALAPALTAALAAQLERRERDGARRLVRRSLSAVALSGGALALLLGGTSDLVARLLVPGFTPEEAHLAARLLCELLPYGLFTSLALLAAAALNAAGAYWTPVAAVLSANGVSLALLLLAGRTLGIHAAAWALSAGSLLQVLVSLGRLAGVGLLAKPTAPAAPVPLPWRDSAVLALSLALAGAVDLAERPFASAAGVGAIALLAFASKLIHLPMRLFAAPLAAVAFPRLVRARQRDGAFSTGEADSTARLVLDLLLYAAAVTAGASGPLVALTLGRGRFDAASVATLAKLLLVLSPAIVAIGFVEIGSKYLVAAGRTASVARAQAAGLASYVLAASLLARQGVTGLAVARDVAWGVAALGLALALLVARKESPALVRMLRPFLAALAAAVLAGLVVRHLPGGSLIRLAAAALLAAAAFVPLAWAGRLGPATVANAHPG